MKTETPKSYEPDPRYRKLRIQMLLHHLSMTDLALQLKISPSTLSSHFSGYLSFNEIFYNRARKAVHNLIKIKGKGNELSR